MASVMENLEARLREAVRLFWKVRKQQARQQGGTVTTAKDRGQRGAVTGGKQMDGFIRLVYDLLVEAGLNQATISCHKRTELPGWFRPEKDWDLLVVVEGCLLAALEFKSQVGSFGNNYNNRAEEALGNASDLWAAYREGAFKPSLRPWLGYMMLLEEAPGSTRPVRTSEPHFKVFPEFRDASYARRYEILLTKLVRERLYDAACFLLSTQKGGLRGEYGEPNPELGFRNFVTSLMARMIATAKTQPPAPPSPPVIDPGPEPSDGGEKSGNR
ncbi:MAG TPA: PaeR7I family type II restriction endonuclease [Gemmataceae bacterium]|nr:PaeR7I family type II restriction endonuclease [Gemmataceae bacterium]